MPLRQPLPKIRKIVNGKLRETTNTDLTKEQVQRRVKQCDANIAAMTLQRDEMNERILNEQAERTELANYLANLP